MYNYYIEMDLKNYTNIITNLSIAITFIYCIILIIDELYNIGLFSFKYTYLYNYGSFISEFNNIQTIECETNRFNLYSNDIFLYKDIFSKSYFNYLIIIAITFITILFVLAYGINFYFTFIINQPEVCSFYKSTSFIKIIMKCLCDTCHEFIPDCTGNYFISFIIIIIIPLTYFLKSFLNIDITPNSTSVLFSFGYIILFIILLFTYSFILFNINKTDNNTNERLKDVGVYIFFTIIFITSGYIYKYIYNKYTDLTLTKTRNPETFYDIYKQAPPIKPRPIQEPTYKGKNLLNSTFKYDPKNTDIDYKQKKEIMDEYYISIRNYDKDMNYYTQKYNNYINSKSKLGDTTNIINIIINILGLNNYIHLYIIALLIFVSVIYYFYNNDLLLVCVIYLICVLTILTIINAILYYNTIVNKYIIYEPQSYYKNDITNTNTKLNLLLDPSNGDGFYNILTNNQLKSKSLNLNITPEAFITNVKSLTVFENFTFSNISNINTNSSNLIIPQSDNIISPDTYTLYYSSGSSNDIFNESNVIKHIFNKIDSFSSINTIDIFNYNYNPIMFIDIYYNSNKKIQIQNLKFYNRYVYYYSYLFENLLIKLGSIYTTSSKKCYKYQKLFNKIKINYINYKLQTTDNALITLINSDITSIKSIDAPNFINTTLTTGFFNNLDKFIENNIIVVNNFILNEIYSKVITPAAPPPPATTYYFINKLNITSDKLTFAYANNKITPSQEPLYHANIIDDPSKINLYETEMIIITPKDNIFDHNSKLSILYVEVPLKIIDNNFNELHIKTTTTTPITKVSFTEYPPKSVKKVKAYSKSIYNDSNVLYDINITNSGDPDTSISTIDDPSNLKTYFKAPYVLKAISSSSSSEKSNFNQIILSSLLNNLIHITSKYEFKDLKQKLYYKALSTDLTINKIERVSYSEKFNIIDISKLDFETKNFLHKSSTSVLSYEAYAILLYNIYTYDKNRIIDIIEYFIYKNVIYTDSIYASDEYLHEKILSIRTQIDKTVSKTDLITLYEKNRYIVNLILKIYDNLIKYIKKEIETSIDPSLCNSTSATTMNIEQQLYNHLNAYLTITTNPTNVAIFSAAKTSSLTVKNQETITNIGITITYFFNICIFLLNNIDSGDKIEDDNKENIISNFKFYNMDDTINLEVSNLENIRRNLSINCDYYSKYNNLDKKQKLYMKINTDNVGYTFPILIIIFVVIFGETAFIKS